MKNDFKKRFLDILFEPDETEEEKVEEVKPQPQRKIEL